ncbi:hypothetical protein LINGRAHAP2_LOCUS8078 [Linum grandiflorum]
MMFGVPSLRPQLFIRGPCVTFTSRSQLLLVMVTPWVLFVPSLLAPVRK